MAFHGEGNEKHQPLIGALLFAKMEHRILSGAPLLVPPVAGSQRFGLFLAVPKEENHVVEQGGVASRVW